MYLFPTLCIVFYHLGYAKIFRIENFRGYIHMEDYQVAPDDSHELIFEVKPKNMDKLESILHVVSDPFSRNYGSHLTRDEVTALTKNNEGLVALRSFFSSNDIQVISESLYGEFMTTKTSISTWERVFSTKFLKFQHVENMLPTVLRALHYTIPDSIAPFVETVYKVTDFPITELTPLAKASTFHPINNTVSPALLNSYYNIFSNTGSTETKQTIFSSYGQYWSSADLAAFQARYDIPSHPINSDPDKRVSDYRCINNFASCWLGNQNTQYLTAIAQNTSISVEYDVTDDIFLSWITGVANSATPSDVYTFSYSYPESYMTAAAMTSFNNQAMKLGVMGVTVVVASGDDGAPGSTVRLGSNCMYDPSFPASSPYVVAVGATMGPESGKKEVACQTDRQNGPITSGGGFSKFAKRLPHQDRAVKAYFATVSTSPVSGYSTTGRGYPDVALMAKYYQTIIGGKTYYLSGTVVAAPVFAAMVSLVNAARLKIGRSTLGFLNPALYAYNGSFANDITSGNNKCTESVCCTQGFYTAKGWDPVTGFGSVDFTKFYNLFATPSSRPTSRPTSLPTKRPVTARPVVPPTRRPTSLPTTKAPSTTTSRRPTSLPTTKAPSTTPSRRPSAPTITPTKRAV